MSDDSTHIKWRPVLRSTVQHQQKGMVLEQLISYNKWFIGGNTFSRENFYHVYSQDSGGGIAVPRGMDLLFVYVCFSSLFKCWYPFSPTSPWSQNPALRKHGHIFVIPQYTNLLLLLLVNITLLELFLRARILSYGISLQQQKEQL